MAPVEGPAVGGARQAHRVARPLALACLPVVILATACGASGTSEQELPARSQAVATTAASCNEAAQRMAGARLVSQRRITIAQARAAYLKRWGKPERGFDDAPAAAPVTVCVFDVSGLPGLTDKPSSVTWAGWGDNNATWLDAR